MEEPMDMAEEVGPFTCLGRPTAIMAVFAAPTV